MIGAFSWRSVGGVSAGSDGDVKNFLPGLDDPDLSAGFRVGPLLGLFNLEVDLANRAFVPKFQNSMVIGGLDMLLHRDRLETASGPRSGGGGSGAWVDEGRGGIRGRAGARDRQAADAIRACSA